MFPRKTKAANEAAIGSREAITPISVAGRYLRPERYNPKAIIVPKITTKATSAAIEIPEMKSDGRNSD